MKQFMQVEQLVGRVQAAWDAARGPQPLPRRADIDLASLGQALQYLSVIDVVPGDPIDFRYRVLGPHLIKGFGLDPTGQLHTEIADRSRTAWPFYEAFASCVGSARPQTIDINSRNRKNLIVQLRGRLWPLSDGDANVTGILGAAMFFVPAPAVS